MKKQVKQTDDKKINIPNNIHFYSDICGLLLQINDNQLLFESDKRYWLANLLMYANDEVKCKLKLCKFDDLKEGDFFVDDIKTINHISDYKIIIDKIKSKKLLSYVRYNTTERSLRNIRVIYEKGVKLYKVVMTNNKNKK